MDGTMDGNRHFGDGGERPPLNTFSWDRDLGARHRPGWKHALVLVLLIAAGILVGSFSSLSFTVANEADPGSPAFGVNYFWVGIAVQQVGGIWFGAWGVLAGMIFPIFSNAVTKASVLVSLAYLPANFVQSFLPAWVFRKFKLDPGLNSTRDYIYLVLSMLISNLFGALWSVFALVVVLGQLDRSQALNSFVGWFGGNLLAGVIFNFILLRALSGVISTRDYFVRRWWA